MSRIERVDENYKTYFFRHYNEKNDEINSKAGLDEDDENDEKIVRLENWRKLAGGSTKIEGSQAGPDEDENDGKIARLGISSFSLGPFSMSRINFVILVNPVALFVIFALSFSFGPFSTL